MTDHSWLTRPLPSLEETREFYDGWSGEYERDVAQWLYASPIIVAAMLTGLDNPRPKKILDAGCGTGLCGKSLQTFGLDGITGMDVSSRSLALARQSGAYDRLVCADLDDVLPFDDGEFTAVVCAGVLSYMDDVVRPMTSFCRVVRSGGWIAFTDRDDLFRDRRHGEAFARLEDDCLWSRVCETRPLPYIPGNPDFADRTNVKYFLYRVR